MSYRELSGKPDFSEIQPRVLDYWLENHVFQKSLDIRQEQETVFYDGPPFPTGKPHHGTVLVSFIKDMIARYWTMRGYKVPRVWGWDCHGLPIENQAEQLLGITDKNEIEKNLGIGKFNDKCFEIVSSNNEAWREYISEMARWVDYDGAYKTMTPEFMESVMWAFKTCYDKGLIYRDYRVTPYCAYCETSLSISDTRESDSTRLRQDRWVIIRFRADQELEGKPVYLLAWTTTPWTLPSNLCLAVGKDLDYAYVEIEGELYIACKSVLGNYPKIFGKEPVIVKQCKGSDLLGMTYEPLFPYFADKKAEGAFRVVSADYVGADEGVGIVHTAPAFGEDDYWTCKNNNIPLVNPVDAKGSFTDRGFLRLSPEPLAQRRGAGRQGISAPRDPAQRRDHPVSVRHRQGRGGRHHRPQLPPLLALQAATDLQGHGCLLFRHRQGQGPADRAQREHQLGARDRQARPLRQLAGRCP